MRSSAAKALCALLLTLSALVPSGFAGPPGSPLAHRGRWLTDAAGRVVILHGVNMVNKLPPYHPAALGFGEDDAAFIARAGFNTVRLGIIYKGLEPKRGHFDVAYLERIALTARILGKYGIHVLVDFHQDLYNERFNGEGFPDWAVQDDGIPAQPDGGFPANYFLMPALWRAFDHFLANDPGPDGVGLQDAYAAAWRRVAERLRSESAIMGYDIMNEPWPGSMYATCLNPVGCPVFDQMLTPFYKRVFAAIRKVDRTRLVFYEPHPQMAGTGGGVYIGDTGDKKAGFTFHFYCLEALGAPGALGGARCPAGEDRPFEVADAISKRTGDALLVSEFGGTDDLLVLRQQLDLFDRHMMSWQYWAYWGNERCCEHPGYGIINDPSKPPVGTNVKQVKVALLARPYPRAVAGTPVSWLFNVDRPDRTFEFTYMTDPKIGLPTEIFVPKVIYPRGYRVTIRGPAKVTSKPGAQILTIATSARGRVVVTVAR